MPTEMRALAVSSLLVALSGLAALPGVSRGQEPPDTAGWMDSVAHGLAATDTSLGLTYERFGIDLLRGAVKNAPPDSSRILSPLSAGQALVWLLAGARDSTATLMRRGLRLGDLSVRSLAAGSRRLNEDLRARRDVRLRVANALWADTSTALRPEFAALSREQFAAVARVVPLSGREAILTVNRWADSVTDGLIPRALSDTFPWGTELVVSNAVSFKGLWLLPFQDSLTRARRFTAASGDRLSVPTMEGTFTLAYRRGRGYQALRIPYRAGLVAMYLVLPDSGLTAVALPDSLAASGWPLPDPRREAREVELRLPRLHVEQGTDLRPALMSLGMGIVFDSSRADFGGLVLDPTRAPPPCPPLSSGLHLEACTRHRISAVAQQVYLDVDEQGTKAAAVTVAGVQIVATGVIEPIRFIVDRPFLFAVRDERTGTFLFMGYVAAPAR